MLRKANFERKQLILGIKKAWKFWPNPEKSGPDVLSVRAALRVNEENNFYVLTLRAVLLGRGVFTDRLQLHNLVKVSDDAHGSHYETFLIHRRQPEVTLSLFWYCNHCACVGVFDKNSGAWEEAVFRLCCSLRQYIIPKLSVGVR